VNLNHVIGCKLSRNSTTQIQIEPLQSGTQHIIYINGRTIDLSTPITCDVTTNLITATGADAGITPSASTKYYAYISNALVNYAPLSLRLSATSPTNGYLGTSGDAENWRYIGIARTNSSTQFKAVGAVRNLPITTDTGSGQTMFHNQAVVISGTGFSTYVDSLQMYGFYTRFTSPSSTDKWYYPNKLRLSAGTYDFKVLVQTASDSGIISWLLDEDVHSLGVTDLYSSSIVYNVVLTIPNRTIPEDGLYSLYGQIHGKNLSSSDYYSRITQIWFEQTSD